MKTKTKTKAIKYSILLNFILVWLFSAQVNADSSGVVGLPDFTELAEKNTKIVVNIRTSKHVKRSYPKGLQGVPEEMLRFLFGLPPNSSIPKQFNHPKKLPEEVIRSLGSGFIISSDGYILTNHHVISGADEIIVKLHSRKELKAKVIGSDAKTDIALLKIDAINLPYATIGNSKDLKVGQWVLAIGEPFGLDYTVSHGIVSALSRALPDDRYIPFIQTDVPINPGNSGGPLFNLKGQVVGVNAQIFSKSGGYMGLSFSIPIDIAMSVVKQLKKRGVVKYGFLGVQIQQVTNKLAKSFGLSKSEGALVSGIVKDSAADEANLKPGDIILEFNGRAINKSSDLPFIVGVSPIGKSIKAKIIRQKEIKDVYIKLKFLNEKKLDVTKTKNLNSEINTGDFGAEVSNLTRNELRNLNLPFGVKVIQVKNGGIASKAGILPNDILVTINFKPIKSLATLQDLLSSSPKKVDIPVRIVRNGNSLFIPLVIK